MLDTAFIEKILLKYSISGINAYIADSNSRILVSTQNDCIGRTGNTARYISMTGRSATIQRDDTEPDGIFYYGTPVNKDGSLEYIVVTYGPPENIEKIGTMIQVALQTALEYSDYEHEKNITPLDRYDTIAMLLLSEKPDISRIQTLMYSSELEPDLMRAVIYIRLEYNQNTYFNINLNLGYEAAIEKLRLEIVSRIRRSKYINTQDIVYAPDRNTIIVIKSFINTEDVSRLYSALEAVCDNIMETLKAYSSVAFSIAYGNFYKGIKELYKSWKEAYEMLKIGKKLGMYNFYNLDNLLFEYIGKHLEAQIEQKFIVPAMKKLIDFNGNLQTQLVDNAEVYVDSCMRLPKASEKLKIHRNTICSRLRKFEAITGLNPEESFKDAFLVKMLAVYLKNLDSHIVEET